MPVMTAAFDEPLLEPPERALELDRCELLPPDERELPDDPDDERRLDALELLGLPLELPALLPFEDLLREEALLLLGLEPFELREVVFLLPWDRELAWAISPP